jgi:hypothetical protein
VLGAVKSIVQGIKRVGSGDAWSAGDMSLNGGEFLFVRGGEGVEGEGKGDGPRVEWCHRMRNTRDHTEVEDLKAVLGLNAEAETERKETKADDLEKEKEKVVQPLPPAPATRRSTTTSKLHRSLSQRSQSWVHSLMRSHTMRAGRGGQESRPIARRFHSHSGSVQLVRAS